MATETEFVTAPSTPEPADPMAPVVAEPPPPALHDTFEIVVEQRLRQHARDGGSSSPMTIFRVPAHVRDASKELYEPRLVSVGPYYRGRAALRAMEQHKWRYLHELLAEFPEASLADCVRAVRGVEHQARRCYSERTDIFAAGAGAAAEGENWQPRQQGDTGPGDGFAEMLLLDGGFVLQFFIKWYRREPDKLCDVGWGLPLLLSDLLLLENQIPFFVLEALFDAVNPEASRLGLLKLIVPHFKLDDSTFCKEVLAGVVPTEAGEIHHLLHLLYEAFVPRAEELASSPPPPPRYDTRLARMGLRFKTAVSKRFVFVRDMPRVPGWRRLSASMTLLRKVSAWFGKALIGVKTQTEAEPPEPDDRSTAPPPPMVVPSVTQLREAGVRFEMAPSPRHMFDVTFDAARGVLRMPRMEVDYANKAQLVNLVAFEQTMGGLQGGGGGGARLLSSYAALVGALARTDRDVEHLQERGVAENLLSGDGDAATRFFQQLGGCSSLDYGDHHFAAMFRDLSGYYHSSWRRHKAKFLRDHCSSPWAVLALVVAGCAFCFALIKFGTTMYGLAHPYCHC
ncbi:hypothetical protein PAHAL_1G121800 [Panicum hallii]|jgi:hypothetical protein|uniref:Uncharacterized protein n=1 Tax=Panicum hallii TaxID=206008 RepID=A0A2S3GNN9_9POAL|nr:putative UPF0481 protein At3g02645 [Panicum hallii]PAN05205.1 hypothetical protein PAHAL_1G121800 [Panicum hallii]